MSNVYDLMLNKADDQLTRVKNLFGESLTWQVFKEEFIKEYITKNYRKKKVASFIKLVKGLMTIREYVDKFEDSYKYAKNIYSTQKKKSKKIKQGLLIILRCKLNLYIGTFRSRVEKTMD